jgi:hypothetical protein
MSQIVRNDLILAEINVRNTGTWKDKITSSEPDMWDGTDLGIKFYLYAGALSNPLDVSVYDTITLQVRETDDPASDLFINKTIAGSDLDNAVTEEDWEEESGAHGVILCTHEETNLPLAGASERTFCMVLAATTNDVPSRFIILGKTQLTVKRSGFDTGAEAAPLGDPRFLTEDQINAKLQNFMQPILRPGQSISLPDATNQWRTVLRTVLDPITGQPSLQTSYEQVVVPPP